LAVASGRASPLFHAIRRPERKASSSGEPVAMSVSVKVQAKLPFATEPL
jgi:hypothetical protein